MDKLHIKDRGGEGGRRYLSMGHELFWSPRKIPMYLFAWKLEDLECGKDQSGRCADIVKVEIHALSIHPSRKKGRVLGDSIEIRLNPPRITIFGQFLNA